MTTKLKAILGNLRPLRAIVFATTALLGGLAHFLIGEKVQALPIFYTIVAFVFVWEASVMWNDIYDIAIDRKSNPHRPLIVGTVTVREYHFGAILLSFLAVLLALLVNLPVLGLVAFSSFLAWAYSAPPLRWRQNFGSYAVIGISLVITFLAGKLAASDSFMWPDQNTLEFLGWVILYGTFIPIAKDLKDYEADKAEGVMNLFTALGKDNAKKVYAALFFFILCGTIFVAPKFWLPIFTSAAFCAYHFLKKGSLAFVYSAALVSGCFLFFFYFQ